MKYVKDYRCMDRVELLARAIRKMTVHAWNIMEVCGGQTHSIARYRIEEMLPPSIQLLHGPGCPVCVTPEDMMDHALEIAGQSGVILASFGDMVRVPGSVTDLMKAKALGADIRVLYSPLDAVDLASRHPDKEVVFFAVGFETTAPVHLAALKEAIRRRLKNFSLLTSLFAVPPVIDMLLSQPDHRIDGFLTAGHVCAVTGNSAYHALSARYNVPMVVTGFEPADLLYGIYRCILQLEGGSIRSENAYKRMVREEGNPGIKRMMEEMLEPVDREWRGIGLVPSGGLRLRNMYAAYDAAKKFPFRGIAAGVSSGSDEKRMCIAGEIMKGNKGVSDCIYFGSVCTPERPLGAPMVSSEGVCAAYHNYK